MAEQLTLVVSTINKEHNFLGLFDEAKKVWLKEREFQANGAEELFLIWKKMFPLKSLANLKKVVIDQSAGSFSGLRLSLAVTNSLKIAYPKVKLFSTKAQNILILKKNVEKNIDIKEEKDFALPEYSHKPSIT